MKNNLSKSRRNLEQEVLAYENVHHHRLHNLHIEQIEMQKEEDAKNYVIEPNCETKPKNYSQRLEVNFYYELFLRHDSEFSLKNKVLPAIEKAIRRSMCYDISARRLVSRTKQTRTSTLATLRNSRSLHHVAISDIFSNRITGETCNTLPMRNGNTCHVIKSSILFYHDNYSQHTSLHRETNTYINMIRDNMDTGHYDTGVHSSIKHVVFLSNKQLMEIRKYGPDSLDSFLSTGTDTTLLEGFHVQNMNFNQSIAVGLTLGLVASVIMFWFFAQGITYFKGYQEIEHRSDEDPETIFLPNSEALLSEEEQGKEKRLKKIQRNGKNKDKAVSCSKPPSLELSGVTEDSDETVNDSSSGDNWDTLQSLLILIDDDESHSRKLVEKNKDALIENDGFVENFAPAGTCLASNKGIIKFPDNFCPSDMSSLSRNSCLIEYQKSPRKLVEKMNSEILPIKKDESVEDDGVVENFTPTGTCLTLNKGIAQFPDNVCVSDKSSLSSNSCLIEDKKSFSTKSAKEANLEVLPIKKNVSVEDGVVENFAPAETSLTLSEGIVELLDNFSPSDISSLSRNSGSIEDGKRRSSKLVKKVDLAVLPIEKNVLVENYGISEYFARVETFLILQNSIVRLLDNFSPSEISSLSSNSI